MVKEFEDQKEENAKKIKELEERLANIDYFLKKKTEMELLRESLKK
jgi:hypothetical protein